VARVSIVVATHDQGRWLGEALDGVLAQSFRDWELVVVDDGSTDGTRDVVRRYTDPRVRYVFQPHAERCVARNRGVDETAAPLVAFLDADDRWLPEKLARQVAALEAAPEAAMCYTVARFIGLAGERLPLRKPPRGPIAGDIFAALMRGNVIILASVVVRRACLDAVGGFDPALAATGCEDWDLWLRIARRYPVIALDEELTLYRRHPGNTGWARVLEGALRVVDKCYADPDTRRRARLSRNAVRARHFWLNAAEVARADRRTAMGLALRALREAPATALTRPAAATATALLFPRGAR
jgi:glycosyltransferase involved in cell wall biosynthesis